MASDEEKKPSRLLQFPVLSNLDIFLAVSTNLLTIYILCSAGAGGSRSRPIFTSSDAPLRELNATRWKLSNCHAEFTELQNRLETASGLLQVLLTELGRRYGDKEDPDDLDGWPDELFGEMKLAAEPHKMPLGHNKNLGTDELFPTLGFACRRFQEELVQYMSYEPGGECPSDALPAQRLMLKGCEPLPPRRCRPPSPKGYVEPRPLPESLWATPPDTTVVWDAYTCKNYSCLVHRGSAAAADCNDCFDLGGRESKRWQADDGALDFGIDTVLAARPTGTVRIGVDIGGGSGTFAARMRERGVTMVTTTMDLDGPFNSFVAARGLVPMQVSIAQRLPFFDNTLDIVHSMHVFSHWMPVTVMEFALYDVFRMLRPGGLFWLDHFFCVGEQLNATYVPMLDRVGFNRLRWATGRKLDRGRVRKEWYLSALLEKPMK